jgi:hypothetical protein
MRKNLINRLLELSGLTSSDIALYKMDLDKRKREAKKFTAKKDNILSPVRMYENSLILYKDLKIRRHQMVKYLNDLTNTKLLEHFESKVREEEADKYIDYY